MLDSLSVQLTCFFIIIATVLGSLTAWVEDREARRTQTEAERVALARIAEGRKQRLAVWQGSEAKRHLFTHWVEQ